MNASTRRQTVRLNVEQLEDRMTPTCLGLCEIPCLLDGAAIAAKVTAATDAAVSACQAASKTVGYLNAGISLPCLATAGVYGGGLNTVSAGLCNNGLNLNESLYLVAKANAAANVPCVGTVGIAAAAHLKLDASANAGILGC